MKKIIAVLLIIIQIVSLSIYAIPAAGPFKDVSSGRWSAEYITFAVDKGYMTGIGNGRFDPTGNTSRAMVVTVLYRMSGTDSSDFSDSLNPFKDIRKNKWYYEAVIWANSKGIVKGITKDKFDPDSPITREQLCTVIYRYSYLSDNKYSKVNGTLSKFFDRADASSYASDGLCWCIQNEIISGTEKKRLTPKGFATREQFATILYRYFNNGIRLAEDVLELPSIYITCDKRYSSILKIRQYEAHYIISGGDLDKYKDFNYEGDMLIKGRGNSTAGASKRPFKIKLNEKIGLFGMEKSKHWVLLANHYDRTLMRNYLSYHLGEKLGLPSSESVPVQLYYNGEYYGLYQLCEHVRVGEGRVEIYDWEETAKDVAKAIYKKENLSKEDRDLLEDELTEDLSWITSGFYKNYVISDYYDTSSFDISGGYLLEIDTNGDENTTFYTKHGSLIMSQSPEFLRSNYDMFMNIRTSIQNAEDAFASPIRLSEEGKHYSEYMDMDSFMAFWAVNLLFRNVEYLDRSCFIYKDVGDIIRWGPIWDMDYSSGNAINLGGRIGYNTWDDGINEGGKYWSRALYSDPWFIVNLYEYWNGIGDEIDDMFRYMDELSDETYDGMIDNWQRWSFTTTVDHDIDILKSWLENRRDWMDEQMSSPEKLMASLDFADKSNELKITDINIGKDKITFKVESGNDDAKYCDILFNGRLIEKESVLKNGKIFEIDSSLLRDDGLYNSINAVAVNENREFINVEKKYKSAPDLYLSAYAFIRK